MLRPQHRNTQDLLLLLPDDILVTLLRSFDAKELLTLCCVAKTIRVLARRVLGDFPALARTICDTLLRGPVLRARGLMRLPVTSCFIMGKVYRSTVTIDQVDSTPVEKWDGGCMRELYVKDQRLRAVPHVRTEVRTQIQRWKHTTVCGVMLTAHFASDALEWQATFVFEFCPPRVMTSGVSVYKRVSIDLRRMDLCCTHGSVTVGV